MIYAHIYDSISMGQTELKLNQITETGRDTKKDGAMERRATHRRKTESGRLNGENQNVEGLDSRVRM